MLGFKKGYRVLYLFTHHIICICIKYDKFLSCITTIVAMVL